MNTLRQKTALDDPNFLVIIVASAVCRSPLRFCAPLTTRILDTTTLRDNSVSADAATRHSRASASNWTASVANCKLQRAQRAEDAETRRANKSKFTPPSPHCRRARRKRSVAQAATKGASWLLLGLPPRKGHACCRCLYFKRHTQHLTRSIQSPAKE